MQNWNAYKIGDVVYVHGESMLCIKLSHGIAARYAPKRFRESIYCGIPRPAATKTKKILF